MTASTVKDLLLAPRLEKDRVATLLAPFGFKDPIKADANLQDLARDIAERKLVADMADDLLHCISRSADPDQALTYLERFARAGLNRAQLFSYLRDSPRAMEMLARTLGGSPYMAEILIRDPHHFYWVTDPQIVERSRTRREIRRELLRTLKALPEEQQQLDYIRFFKRREMLHIGVRDLLRLCTVEETLSALSLIAEELIAAAYSIAAATLRRYWTISPEMFTGFTVLAMGKLGGGELNFSSDVDLMYLYASGQKEPDAVSAPEYFRKLSQKISGALNEFTGEGYVYRVDLRLRPEGEAGYIADALESFERYYRSRMGTWERLALLKAWPVAGDKTLGRAFLSMIVPFIYDRPFDKTAQEDIRSMKRKIDEQMADREQRSRNVKLGTGGIREIELIVQSLQVCFGGRSPQIRERQTLKALAALRVQSLLSEEDYDVLAQAYVYLRDVENKLQMVNDAQTHSLPRAREELIICARLMGCSEDDLDAAVDHFLRDYRQHTSRVNGIFERVLGSDSSCFT